MKINIVKYVKASGRLLQCQRPGAKTTEVETHVALVCASTDDSSTNLIRTVVDWVTSSSIPCINGIHKHQKVSS